MSTQVGTNAARTLFDDYVKHSYQSMGPDLRDCVTFRATTGVETYKFRTMGRGLAQARGASQSLINEMGISHSTVTCTLEDWIASQPTDIFDQAKTSSPQEIQALAKVIAGALKRRETQLVIDKLDAATMATGHTIVDGNVGLTVAKLTEARKLLKANDINEPVPRRRSRNSSPTSRRAATKTTCSKWSPGSPSPSGFRPTSAPTATCAQSCASTNSPRDRRWCCGRTSSPSAASITWSNRSCAPWTASTTPAT